VGLTALLDDQLSFVVQVPLAVSVQGFGDAVMLPVAASGAVIVVIAAISAKIAVRIISPSKVANASLARLTTWSPAGHYALLRQQISHHTLFTVAHSGPI
jgi:hypothetical protein